MLARIEYLITSKPIVTDMNEFRLYWFDRAPEQYLSYVISPQTLFQGKGLVHTWHNEFKAGKLCL